MKRRVWKLWGRLFSRYHLRAFRMGYAEGYDAALDTIDALYALDRESSYNRGYERGYLKGREDGISKRAHYTRLMVGDEE